MFTVSLLLSLVASWVPSYWYDEAATLRLARLPWDEFLQFVMERDAVHGLYGAFMHLWIGLVGEAEFLVRLPSAVAVALSALGVFVIARHWSGPSAAMVGALIFTLLPRTLLQGIEARSYAIATALIVAAAVLIIRARNEQRVIWWLAYVVAAALAIWTFAYAILVLPAFAILADRSDRPPRERAGRAAIILILPALLASPLIVMMTRQRGQVSWLADQPVNPYTILVEPFFGWAAWLLMLVVGVFAWAMWRRELVWSRPLAALMVWLLGPGLVLIAVTLVTVPVFTPRYLTVSTAALAILCAVAIRRWKASAQVALALAWVIAVVPFAVSTRMPTAKPGGLDLRTIAELIESNASPGDGFLLESTGIGALRPRTVIAAYPRAFDDLVDLEYAGGHAETGTYWDALRPISPDSLTGFDRVWGAGRDLREFGPTLSSAGFHQAEGVVITGVRVSLWERDPLPEPE